MEGKAQNRLGISIRDAVNSSTCELQRSSSRNNNNNRDNARNATPRDPFSYNQIASIISYRIITANCSGLPLPTSLHTARPLWRPGSLCRRRGGLFSLRLAFIDAFVGDSSHLSPSLTIVETCSMPRGQMRRCSRKHTVNSNLAEL